MVLHQSFTLSLYRIMLYPRHVQEIAGAENWKKMKMQILMSAMKKC